MDGLTKVIQEVLADLKTDGEVPNPELPKVAQDISGKEF